MLKKNFWMQDAEEKRRYAIQSPASIVEMTFSAGKSAVEDNGVIPLVSSETHIGNKPAQGWW